jgi:FtsP/CotA-like multicopper oxidase with cupredoxin domain
VVVAVVAAAGGYGVLPSHAASVINPGVRLGHVPIAPRTMSATIVIGRNAAVNGYSTRSVTISAGATLSVVNLDDIAHTVTAVGHRANGSPLFDVEVGPGDTRTIPGASSLAGGTYAFYCRFHPTMTGQLTVEGDGGGTHPVPQRFEQPLKTPKVLTGAHLQIPIEPAKVRVMPHGPKTAMWTYDGSYPGPTIRRPAGHDTKVTFTDDLPASAGGLTVHFHGDHHTSADDGQPDSHLIQAGQRRTYDYPLTDDGHPERAAFDFYHDHRMGETGRNNWRGLQGMFITDDNRTPKLKLPTGRYDVPLQVSDRSFTADNQLTDPFPTGPATMPTPMTGPGAPPGDATVGNHILVDGRFAPYLKVTQHRYRLRLLNSSNFTSYDFALSTGQPLVQIGTGSGLLPQPVIRQDILLGPAQRADVIVDFHHESTRHVILESIPRTDNAPQGIGTPQAELMEFNVGRAVKDHTKIPATLEAPPPLKAPAKVSATWEFGLGGDATTGTYWTVNGKPFDPHRVDLDVPLGSRQTWLLKNVSPITHYIHIHEEQWHTVSRDGAKPPPWERGLEDTWRLDPGETVEVAAKFTDYTGVFMIHCHMLDHEDHGMMAQFAVVKPGTKATPAGFHDDNSAVPGVPARHHTAAMAGMSSVGDAIPLPASPTSAAHRTLQRTTDALVIEIVAVGTAYLCLRRRPRARSLADVGAAS